MARLELMLADSSADVDELHQLALQLRKQLLELDVDRVDFATAEAPDGTRSAAAIDWGTLACTIVQSPVLVQAVVDTVSRWLKGHGQRTVRATIDGDTLELTDASLEEQRSVVEAWLARHETSA